MQTYVQADKQTVSQPGRRQKDIRHTSCHADRQIDRRWDGHTCKWASNKTKRHTYIQTDRQTGIRYTYKPTGGQSKRQTGRKTDRQTMGWVDW